MPKAIKIIPILFGLLVGLSLAQQDNADATLLQGLTTNKNFSTLVGLIDQAGLTDALSGAGPFTIFAPDNNVFSELNSDILDQLNNDPELLKSVLQSHVVQGTYGIKDLRDAPEGSVMTLNGEPLEIALTAGGLKVDGADLVSTDVDNTYSNGVLNQVGDLILSASLRSQLGISDTEEATSDVPATGMNFADLDTDANGVLTQEELDNGIYIRYDTNGDGSIDQTEYDTNPGLFGGAFTDYDTDTSGDLNQDEYRGAFDNAGLFNQLDTDGSGDISQEEYDTNRDLLGLGTMGAAVTGAAATDVGAETGGAETGGADMDTETGGAETGGAETGGAAAGAETGGTATAAQPTTSAATQQTLLDTARVRVVHLVPNAPAADVNLTSTLEGGEVLTPEALTGLSYEATTDYLEVPVGDYTMSVTSEGNPVLAEEVNLAPGISYTVAVIGLVLPGEDAEAEEEEGGFFGFIQNLFSGGSEPDTLALRLLVLEDTLLSPMVEGDTLVRLVHAAPGTDAVDLTIANPEDATQRQNIVDNVAFGEASGYTSLVEGFSEPAITIAGSEAVALDLSDTAFERGTVNTLFVTGTALEQAPLKVIALSDAPQLDPTAAASTTGLLGATDPLQQTIGDVVLADPDLATLVLALDQAGMLELLRQPGPFTLFAPSDEAFAALPQDQLDTLLADPAALTQVLSNHVVQGVVPSAELAGAGMLTSLDGTDLEVTAADDGSLTVGNAAVVVADIQASNGVVHVIDAVLLPAGLELTP